MLWHLVTPAIVILLIIILSYHYAKFIKHLITSVTLVMTIGVLLWANMRPTGWQEALNVDTPEDLDLVTKTMFWRGWPLSPWMVSIDGLRTRSEFAPVAMMLDAAVFALIVVIVGASCEKYLRRRTRNGPRGSHP